MMDLRLHKGRGPKCEIGLCKNRSSVSIGDSGFQGGMGRTNLCDDCLTQLKGLLKGYKGPSEEPVAETIIPEVAVEEIPPDYEGMDRETLMALAKERKLKATVTTKTADIILSLRNHDAQS